MPVAISDDSEARLLRREARLLGTVVEIQALAEPDAIEAALSEIERVGAKLNYFDPESEVGRLSRAAGKEPIEVSSATMEVLAAGARFGRISGGAFDITIGPLLELWGVYDRRYRLPSPEQIEHRLEAVGFDSIRIDPDTRSVLLVRPGMRIDLGGLAKGYLVDRALAVLKRRGTRHALVDAGGDIGTIGLRPDGEAWRIAIGNPAGSGSPLAVLELDGLAVATSADARGFTLGGKRYSHLFDPRSGRPTDRCRSVTVVATTAMEADALSGAAFVLGPEAGLELLESRPGVEGLILTPTGKILRTSGLLTGGGGRPAR